jgi:dTDP-4-dehydrorhamnose 3,5-epimerase-like enzyme
MLIARARILQINALQGKQNMHQRAKSTRALHLNHRHHMQYTHIGLPDGDFFTRLDWNIRH